MGGHGPSRTILARFSERVAREPDKPAIHYFGRSITNRELDHFSDALARTFAEKGVARGVRVAISLQNTPVFAIALLASWKVGAIVVPVNPMVRPGELAVLVNDSGAEMLLAHPDMADVVAAAGPMLRQRLLRLWSSPADLAGEIPGPWPSISSPVPPGDDRVLDILALPRNALGGSAEPSPEDLAVLIYTSGTTGPTKAAMLSHANLDYHAVVTPARLDLAAGDLVLTIAPFFHVTGLGMHLALGLGRGLPLVMTWRFDPVHVLKLVGHYRPRFTVGTVTAYIALSEHAAQSQAGRRDLAAMSVCISGGAAVPPAVVDRYERDFGVYIRNGYGLTETASACVVVPSGSRAPVDPDTGALSIGMPLPGVKATIVGDDGLPVPSGEPGELVIEGPQVGVGYWNQRGTRDGAFRSDGLRTGDVALIDRDGWIYLIDRKKDLIVVSGYKVWPRDVEDALYRHPAVLEAAVVGLPDEYRGESVHAYVVPRAGHTLTANDLNDHCRRLLSAYKCPRHYELVPELPKSSSGKILRRLLRESR